MLYSCMQDALANFRSHLDSQDACIEMSICSNIIIVVCRVCAWLSTLSIHSNLLPVAHTGTSKQNCQIHAHITWEHSF